ncbi:MAG: class I SAM-dependent methyltransferase [Anaerolineae bacterium]
MARFQVGKPRMDALEGWRIAKVLPLVRGRLLDVGCGFNNLVRAYGCGVGVDVFPWAGIDILIGDSAWLPFPDGSFDTVTIVAALNHISNRTEALPAIRRVLRPGGQLIVTMIGPKTGVLAHIAFVRDERTRGSMQPGEKLGMTRREVVSLLDESGFSVVQDIPFQFGLNRVYIATQKGGH